jgi:hypothetical protein
MTAQPTPPLWQLASSPLAEFQGTVPAPVYAGLKAAQEPENWRKNQYRSDWIMAKLRQFRP